MAAAMTRLATRDVILPFVDKIDVDVTRCIAHRCYDCCVTAFVPVTE